MLEFDERLALYALTLCDGVGSVRAAKLVEFAGSPSEVFQLSKRDLARIPTIGEDTAAAIDASKAAARIKAEKDLEHLPPDTLIITLYDSSYPDSLRRIYAPPVLIFTRGNAELLLSERNIAVVGTRKISDYGKRITEELCRSFAANDVTVTSGFAVGVDTTAHRSVYDAGGRTIAVLGSGIDYIYPNSNKQFAAELLAFDRGLIISELPLGTSPDPKNFPARNRIVSGLADAVVIIESDVKGGSMITASLAFDQNKDIFALPGDIGRISSAGPNELIRSNRAKLFRNADDILTEMGWIAVDKSLKSASKKRKNLNNYTIFEQDIIQILDEAGEPLHIDTIAERTGKDVQTLLVELLELEFKDGVRQLGGKYFSTIF
jgi:DNA processing protein